MPNLNRRERPEEYDGELQDDADYKNTKKEEGTPDPEKYVIQELGQVPPAVPIRWAEYDADDWPYNTPEEEFVRSPFPLDMNTLYLRWHGIWHPHEIEIEYARRDWAMMRFDYQDNLNNLAYQKNLENDAQYQARVVRQDIARLGAVLETLHGDLQQGVEYKPVRGAGAFGYVKMPRTDESKAKLVRGIVEVTKLRGARVGLAEEIKRKTVDHNVSLADEMRAARAQRDPEYAKMLNVAGLSLSPAALPSPQETLDITERLQKQPVEAQYVDMKEMENGKFQTVEEPAEEESDE